jgi:competence protein ComEA
VVRREHPDPLLLQTVSARLARLLEETAPPPAEQLPAPGPSGVEPTAADPASSSGSPARRSLECVDELPPPPRFRRLHVGVVAALLLAGLLWCGWSLLRARPVALATPPSVMVSTTGPATPVATARASTSTSTAAGASPSLSGTADQVVVHVLGAVRRPGLVTLSAQARVQDAIDAAGGLTGRADPEELNLAQLLQDGQQVVIGTAAHPDGEVRSGSGSASGPAGNGSSAGGSAPPAGAVLDLNQADATRLEDLPGVGPVTAAAIVAWRNEHGRFSTVEELQEVDGIGPKTYAQIAPHVRV